MHSDFVSLICVYRVLGAAELEFMGDPKPEYSLLTVGRQLLATDLSYLDLHDTIDRCIDVY